MSVLSLSPLSLVTRPALSRCDADVFASFGTARPRWHAFVLSVVLHVAMIASLPALTRISAKEVAERQAARTERILRTLRIRIPEPMYLAAAAPAAVPPRPAVRPAPRPKPAPTGKARAAEPAAPPRRRFELPPAPVRANTEQSLIQPAHLAGTPPAPGLTLPDMFFWAPPPPVRPVKAFVEPGHMQAPAARMRLDAPPSLDIPSAQISSVHVQGLPNEGTLKVPAPLALPIRTSVSEAPEPGAAVAALGPGDPVNVLAISANALPLREYVTVPPGNQVGRTPGAVPGGTLAGTADGSGTGVAGAPGAGSGTGGGASGSGTGTGAGTGAGSGTGINGAEVLAAMRSAIAATRMVTPSNAVFDVVVQSSGVEGFTESAGILSGKPVYSVYLRVGGKRSWILQYCLPASDVHPAENAGAVVRLSAPKRLLAPYPLVTYRPPPRRAGSRYLMLHGFITTEGRFQDLRVLGGGDPWHALAALDALNRWEFRPATESRKPARVEVLVAIPPE